MSSCSQKALSIMLLRRSLIMRRGSVALMRGGPSPPLPPFARIPVTSEPLTEEHDAVFDDGVAPELAFDFDLQNMSSREGLAWWLGALGLVSAFYYYVRSTEPADIKNPALNRLHLDMVMPSPTVGGELRAGISTEAAPPPVAEATEEEEEEEDDDEE